MPAEKIYTYVTNFHGPAVEACDAEGTLVASVPINTTLENAKADVVLAVRACDGRANASIVFVETDAIRIHPVLSKLKIWDEELSGPTEEQTQFDEARLQTIKNEMHICPSCDKKNVCVVSDAIDGAPSTFVTVSACMEYREPPKETTDEDDKEQG